jgi:hypothetical protein
MMRHRSTRGGTNAPAANGVKGYLVVAVLAVLTAACATLSPTSPTEEKVKVVTERAKARWDAILARDFAAAYEYMSPASRATVTPAGFRTIASRLNYKAAVVREVTCEAQACKVKLQITYDAAMMQGVRTLLEESWVIEKGQAWYVWLV